ncbi:Polyketide cyclase / dehydrase and lipid transport [Pedobacter caeni]|uniref:Polyketide cyclase / dehydrase and lipid transport n=2 Tax=Pedobacter caeni TaxID=288992 RepID=A0A1M5KRW0_9SPHI|nr:Polyketide cyclase / dehydrase and lipid transport [Pedobacter caeni]
MIIKIIVVIIAIVSVSLVIAMFSKNKYTLTREIIVNQPADTVFNYLKYLRNQPEYNKWLLLDPNTKISYKGEADGLPGAILTFESSDSKTGKGEFEIKKITAGEKVDFEIRFRAFTANGYMAVRALSPNSTKLTWVYNSGMNWPVNLVLLFIDMDKIIGNDIAESLTNMKHRLE